jgi:hypothetical protein
MRTLANDTFDKLSSTFFNADGELEKVDPSRAGTPKPNYFKKYKGMLMNVLNKVFTVLILYAYLNILGKE